MNTDWPWDPDEELASVNETRTLDDQGVPVWRMRAENAQYRSLWCAQVRSMVQQTLRRDAGDYDPDTTGPDARVRQHGRGADLVQRLDDAAECLSLAGERAGRVASLLACGHTVTPGELMDMVGLAQTFAAEQEQADRHLAQTGPYTALFPWLGEPFPYQVLPGADDDEDDDEEGDA